eukprot:Tamp_35183.p1 GENE.Tamp_35183~~Tamp_35183.p1  ORF type:complete len:156 (+),score=13.74 Tamp_35183:42-509(+)
MAAVLLARTARMRMKGGVAASRGATCACCPFMRADAVRGMSIGKNQWPRDWITRQDRWKDMDSETQRLWRTLGWSETLWEAGRIPPIHRKRWEKLREAEREAAETLGYDCRLWNAEDKASAGGKQKRRNVYPAFDGPGDWESSYVTGRPTHLPSP